MFEMEFDVAVALFASENSPMSFTEWLVYNDIFVTECE